MKKNKKIKNLFPAGVLKPLFLRLISKKIKNAKEYNILS